MKKTTIKWIIFWVLLFMTMGTALYLSVWSAMHH